MFEAALIVFIVFQELLHYKERKQLYSRIQAKDLREYKAVEEKPKVKKKAEEDKPKYEFV